MSNITGILGREELKKHFNEALVNGKVSHAYIFSGEPGTGKKTVAKSFAQILLCEGVESHVEKGDAVAEKIHACGRCESCKMAMEKKHPDIIFIEKETGKKSISVEDIREKLINDVAVKPYKGPYKVYIIKEAQDLSIEAQSAMLKTMEEPPEYAVIILLVNTDSLLLPTIRSRCETIEIPILSDEIVNEYLKAEYGQKDGIKADDIRFATVFSEGKIGRGMVALANPDFKLLKHDVIRLVTGIYDMDYNDMVAAVRKTKDYNDMLIDYFFELMSIWYRDVLMFKSTRDANDLMYKEEISEISKQAQVISYEGLDLITKAVERAKERLRANVSFEVAMEMLLMAIQENMNL